MATSFTAINNIFDTIEDLSLPARAGARRPKRPLSYRNDDVNLDLDFLEDSENLVADGGHWDVEEEEIFWHSCKTYGGYSGKAGQRVLQELRSRGKNRVMTSFGPKYHRMQRDLKNCQQILYDGAKEGMWWDRAAHVIRARDKSAQETFLKANPLYKTYFRKCRKWTTAELEMPTLPNTDENLTTGNPTTYNEEASIYDATPPPASLTKKRRRPRKLNQSKSKDLESPVGERRRKRTRELSAEASYEPTSRSSGTLSAPFSTPFRSGSYRARDTSQVDLDEVLRNVELQGMAQVTESAFRPLQPTVEDAPEEEQYQPRGNQGSNTASPPANVSAEEQPRPELQEQHQPPRNQGANTAPPSPNVAAEHPQIRTQQEEPLIKGEPASPPRQLSAQRPATSRRTLIDLTLLAAVDCPDPNANPTDLIYSQIQTDIRKLQEKGLKPTPEGHAAMLGCFANDVQGKYYIRTALNASVDVHLMYVQNQLKQYCKDTGNSALMFQRVRK